MKIYDFKICFIFKSSIEVISVEVWAIQGCIQIAILQMCDTKEIVLVI